MVATCACLQNNPKFHQNTIRYFPNPTKDRLTIETTSDEILLSVIIFNNLGIKQREYQNVKNTKMLIDLNGLKSGQYLIQVMTDSGKRYFNKIILL